MTSAARIVFFGTPEFAVPSLEALARENQVVLVVSQPDRKAGRGRKLSPPPVKTAAVGLGIEVIQPKVVKGRRFAERIAGYAPDFIITAAFGRILGPSLLRTPAKESLNVHASLLPRHRGAAPINWAILSGDRETGVSIMRMDEGLDSGPVFSTVKTPIGPDETAGALSERLALLGAEALVDMLRRYDSLEPVEQVHENATWATMLKKSDGVVDWTRDAEAISRQVRGMTPWPGATTQLEGQTIKIHRAGPLAPSALDEKPGTVVAVSEEGIDVACRPGVLRLEEIQAAGRKRMPVAAFLAGASMETGTVLGK
jgi:methionyl-tRNA formyltransferase